MWLMNAGADIAEWVLNSYSVKLRTATHPAGFVMTHLGIELHICRKHAFYHEKVIVPLLFLTLGAFFLHLIPVEDLEDRIEAMFTLFLAAMTLLNGTHESLPKLDFLTVIDKALYLTLSTLLWLGLESWIVFQLHNTDPSLAHRVDVGLALAVPPIYLIIMFGLFRPLSATMAIHLREQREEHYNARVVESPVESLKGNVDVDAGGLADGSFAQPFSFKVQPTKRKVGALNALSDVVTKSLPQWAQPDSLQWAALPVQSAIGRQNTEAERATMTTSPPPTHPFVELSEPNHNG